MRYYPNIDRVCEIADLVSKERDISKLEYLVYTYLTEHYQIGINEEGLKRVSNRILKSKKTIKEIDLILTEEIYLALQSNR